MARSALVALLLVAGTARAETPPDELAAAYVAALKDLHAGKERKAVAAAFQAAADRYEMTPFRTLYTTFLDDLIRSAKNSPPKPTDPPEKRLLDTRAEVDLLSNLNRDALAEFVKASPNDPLVELLSDRTAIPRLIPLFADRSPTRSGGTLDPIRDTPRVCDFALAAIEHLAMCPFVHLGGHTQFHHYSAREREAVAKRVAEWWAEVKDKPVPAGIRAQLPFVPLVAQRIDAAVTLFRHGRDQPSDDRAFALDVLRGIVGTHCRETEGFLAATALEELGDTSAVGILYDKGKAGLGRSDTVYDPQIIGYLCRHAKRKEWVVLFDLSAEEVCDNWLKGANGVWPCVIDSRRAGSDPFIIPFLGLALGRDERVVPSWGDRSPRYAEVACGHLQTQLDRDFGYREAGPAAERTAAIKKAREWWDAEGKAKYTFDYIETHLLRPVAPPPRPKS